ncbi:MAG: hypothetical protein NUV88_01810 [Candidatus Kaiserbacteria bacterium]|nr:hypothetical protein [Candidatus Kaiserbacteria bacterium]
MMNKKHSYGTIEAMPKLVSGGLSSIAATAVLSVASLLAVILWQTNATLSAKDRALHAVLQYSSAENQTDAPWTAQAGNIPESASIQDPNDLSRIGTDAFGNLIGTYVNLKQSGAYTPATGERVANNVAESVEAPVSYVQFTKSDVKTDEDTSYKRMLAYRSDMRTALLPLLQNTEPEFAVFAHYVETGDKNSLAKLETIAGRYQKAAVNAENVVVPKDAVKYHADAVNSLMQFSATLMQMVKYADDPMASLALLRTYNEVELNVFNSFNALAGYQKNKTP